jgi:hypothetical protein
VAGLARPGGNITGQTIIAAQYIGKRLEILRAIVPGVSRIPAERGSYIAARPLPLVEWVFDPRRAYSGS